MIVGSVCSGIEAAAVAWHPLGWEFAWCAETDPFASAVLAHRWGTYNHGDFTKIGADAGPIDLLVGGTPCQAFSVAGAREGLDDPRGVLTLEFAALAQRLRPRWLVWENVPGVLSSGGGRDFGIFLGALAECGYGFAYRVLDAQYLGLAQRRKRVFLVGYLGDWRPPIAVLTQPDSLSGHPAPRREARQDLAGTLGGGSGQRGWSDDTDRMTFVAPTLESGTNRTGGTRPPGTTVDTADSLIVAGALDTRTGNIDDNTALANHLVIGELPEVAGTLGARHGKGPNTTLDDGALVVAFDTTQVTSVANRSNPQPGDPCHPLAHGGHAASHANGGGQVAVAVSLRGRAGGNMPEIDATGMVPASRQAQGGSGNPMVLTTTVRRLTPTECERLMGFPDDYTLIPWRGRTAPDGPRYRVLGNSMAVPAMHWIGRRIAMVDEITTR